MSLNHEHFEKATGRPEFIPPRGVSTKQIIHSVKYINAESDRQVLSRGLTEEGMNFLRDERERVFDPALPRYTVPLKEDTTFLALNRLPQVGDILRINQLLALAAVRGRVKGNVCEFSERFQLLMKKHVELIIVKIITENNLTRYCLQFKKWPDGFVDFKALAAKPNTHNRRYQPIQEPTNIGPTVWVSERLLLEASTDQTFVQWLKNFVFQNFINQSNPK